MLSMKMKTMMSQDNKPTIMMIFILVWITYYYYDYKQNTEKINEKTTTEFAIFVRFLI